MKFLNFKSNSELEFEKIFDAYKQQVYTQVYAVTKCKYAAEEITQEIFIKLWQRQGTLNEVKNLDAYLYTISRNYALNHLRKIANDLRKTNELMQIAVTVNNDTESGLQLAEYKDLIFKATCKLSPQRRIVYEMSKEQGLSYDEIASELNLSKNTVKNHLLAAIEFIRSYLTKSGVDSTIISILFLFIKFFIFD